MFAILGVLFVSFVYNLVARPSHAVSNDVGRFLTTVKVHTGSASVNAEVVATYSAGETVTYDQVLANESRTWISYVGGSGRRNYCCAVDINGSRYIDGPPDLVNNGSSGSGSWADDSWEFLKLPIGYSFGVSDSNLFQGFKTRGKNTIIKKYGITDSQINQTIAAVRGRGVSPAWFLAYAVEEGGGSASGWINHYSTDAGTIVDMAGRDADWIVSQSQKPAQCAWTDSGKNYVDFVPESVKTKGNAQAATLNSGTIGRVYLSGTAAATWATFYPEGLLKEYNKVQNYGDPIKGCRQLISSWL